MIFKIEHHTFPILDESFEPLLVLCFGDFDEEMIDNVKKLVKYLVAVEKLTEQHKITFSETLGIDHILQTELTLTKLNGTKLNKPKANSTIVLKDD